MKAETKKRLIILSPVVIIGVDHLVARVAGHFWGAWAFVPVVLVAWCMSVFFIFWGGGFPSIRKWLKKPEGSFGWAILALSVSLVTLPMFLLHWRLLAPWFIWLPWILIALINPWIEEFYWRGLLLDHTNRWPGWLAIVFSSAVFAINHPMAFGVNSVLNRGGTILVSTFIMGLIWAVVYRKTRSLWWPILGHFLTDLFCLSVPAFLNLFHAGWK